MSSSEPTPSAALTPYDIARLLVPEKLDALPRHPFVAGLRSNIATDTGVRDAAQVKWFDEPRTAFLPVGANPDEWIPRIQEELNTLINAMLDGINSTIQEAQNAMATP